MPDYLADSHALQVIEQRLERVYFAPQIIAEYWRVVTATASQRGGFGWDVGKADLAVQTLESSYEMLADGPAVYGRWRQIVLAFHVTGASIFDARLVALMVAHGLTHILTFNDDDFRRYTPLGIIAVNPSTL